MLNAFNINFSSIDTSLTIQQYFICRIYKLFSYNLGQKVGDKFAKLGKIDFSMECFTADFLQFFNKKRQNLTFG